MFSVQKTIVPSTAVDAALLCHFTNAQRPNLVLARSNRVSVYKLTRQTLEAGKSSSTEDTADSSVRMRLVVETELHGRVTSMQAFRKQASRLDYLVLSFADAKMAIVEYDPLMHAISTVSMHFYEQEKFREQRAFKMDPPDVRIDPSHRCIVMRFYHDRLAILPLWQADTVHGDEDVSNDKRNEYTQLVASRIDERIKNIVDFTFLHGYYEPTLAILFERERSWMGRLKDRKDTLSLIIVSLDLSQRIFPVIHSVDKLPIDAHTVSAVPKPVGGLLVFGVNEIMYFDQGTSGVGVAVNAFAKEVTNFAPLSDRKELCLHLENVQCCYLNARTALLALNDGSLLRLGLHKQGRAMSRFELDRVGKTSIASCLLAIGNNLVFVGSAVGHAALYYYREQLQSSKKAILAGNAMNTGARPAKKMRIPSPAAITHEDEDDELAFLTEEDALPQRPPVLSSAHPDALHANGTLASASVSEPFLLRKLDELVVIGPIVDFTVGGHGRLPNPDAPLHPSAERDRYGDPHSLEIVAATGMQEQSAVSILSRTIRPQIRNTFAFGRDGDWIFRDVFTVICQPEQQQQEAVITDPETYHRYIVITAQAKGSDASIGKTFVMDAGEELRERRDIDFSTRTETILVGTVFENTRMVQVVSTGMRILDADAKLVKEIKVFGSGAYGDDANKRIISASVCDPYVALMVNDGSIIFARGNEDSKEMEIIETPAVHESAVTSCYIYRDETGAFTTWGTLQQQNGIDVNTVKQESASTMEMPRKRKLSPQQSSLEDDLDDDLYGVSNEVENAGNADGDSSTVDTMQQLVCDVEMETPQASYWLLLYKESGALEIWSLPSFKLQFQCNAFNHGPTMLVDSALPNSASSKFKGSGDQIADLLVASMGPPGCRVPYLMATTDRGDLYIYETFTLFDAVKELDEQEVLTPKDRLAIRFRRVEHEYIGRDLIPAIHHPNVGMSNADAVRSYLTPPPQASDADQLQSRPKQRFLVPFANIYGLGEDKAIDGVFLCGRKPVWIFIGERNEVRLHMMQEREKVACFASFHNVNCDRGFLYFTRPGELKIANIDARVNYDFPVPILQSPVNAPTECGEPLGVARTEEQTIDATDMQTDGPLTIQKLTFHPNSQQFCALTSMDTPFFVHREEKVHEDENGYLPHQDDENSEEKKSEDEKPDLYTLAPGTYLPRTRRYFLEIISPLTWRSVDKHAFAQDEHALTVVTCTLDITVSGMARKKQFVIVGTANIKGEDVTCRGKVYIFEIIDVIPEPGRPETNHKLKLVNTEELRGPVSSICALEGFLVVAYGTKVMMYSFENGEKLTGVAFLDVNFYITSMRSLRRFLIIADVQKSIQFVGYQEDPSKLVVLGKDYDDETVLDANFFVDEGAMGFLVADRYQNLQILSYNPQHIASFNGQKLLRKGDFHVGSNVLRLLRISKRPFTRPNSDEPTILRQQGCIYATTHGELGFIMPVMEKAFKRLQDIYTEMVNRLEHPAGLNPKTYRLYRVPPRFGSQPVKNILDGNYLLKFNSMSSVDRMKWARNKGTSEERVLDDLLEYEYTTSFF